MMKIARLTVAGCETYWRVTLPLLLVPPQGFQCFAHPCSQPSRRPVWPPVAPIARLSRPTPARLPPSAREQPTGPGGDGVPRGRPVLRHLARRRVPGRDRRERTERRAVLHQPRLRIRRVARSFRGAAEWRRVVLVQERRGKSPAPPFAPRP